MKKAKTQPKKHGPKAGSTPPASEGLPIRQLKLVGVAALVFGIVTAGILSWDRLFPIPPEQLVEVAWTHECTCTRAWLMSLRAEGFVVRDREMESLAATRRQWHVPNSARGCHPAIYMGYVLDGHVPGEALRRLALERPDAVGLLQISNWGDDGIEDFATNESQFDLLDRSGARRRWPSSTVVSPATKG